MGVAVVAAGLVAVAWFLSGRIGDDLLTPHPVSERPALDDAVVVAVSGTDEDGFTVRLSPGPDSSAAQRLGSSGVYGLLWDGGAGHVGPATTGADGGVSRSLDVVTGVPPRAGQPAALDRAYWFGDPPEGDDLDVQVKPYWTPGSTQDQRTYWLLPDVPFVPMANTAPDGRFERMAVFVHGADASRLDGLRLAGQLGVPVVLLGYRNDTGQPADPSGLVQYGRTEWRDLDEMVRRLMTTYSTTRVTLVGESSGAAVVAAFMEHSPRAALVDTIVLDSPVLSLEASADATMSRALPGIGSFGPVQSLSMRLAQWRYGLDWAAVDYTDDVSWVSVPVLVLHGTADVVAPYAVSDRFERSVPDLVTIVTFPGAVHDETWNADRDRWDRAVMYATTGYFLDRVHDIR